MAAQFDRFRAGRRPVGVGRRLGGEGARGKAAVGVAQPRGPGLADPGVRGQRAPALRVGGAHPELERQRAPGGEHQRLVQGQLLHDGAAGLVAGADRQLGEDRAGHDGLAAHRVRGEPGVGAGGEGAGEQRLVAVAERRRRAEQRVCDVVEAEPGGVDGRRRRVHPVPAVLEGVGGQRDPAGAGAGEERLPVDVRAAQPECGQPLDEGALLGAVGPLQGDGVRGAHDAGDQ
ncbi:hypothetical protein GCM10022227_05850 [Streptomyces sedi]